MGFELIAAVSRNGIIGDSNTNDLLWHLPSDLSRFKETTMGHTVIMGRKTWESIPLKFRPLPGRDNIVLTSNMAYKAPGATVCFGLNGVAAAIANDTKAFVIGGQSIYELFMPVATKLHITRVENEFEGDVMFPDKDKFGHWELTEAQWFKKDRDNAWHQTLLVYERIRNGSHSRRRSPSR